MEHEPRQTPKSATQKTFNMSFRILSMQGKVATCGAKKFVNIARLLHNIEKKSCFQNSSDILLYFLLLNVEFLMMSIKKAPEYGEKVTNSVN
jgi:hypothetical protein